MTPFQLRDMAEQFGIDYRAAVRMRTRYLIQQYEQCCDWITGDKPMPSMMLDECLNELCALKSSLNRKVHTEITPDMIERAKSVKIDSILEFVRGRCHCINPDHPDRRASAYYGTRANVLVCPVCDKKWDAIAIQQHFTGQSFIEAVKALC